MSKKEHQFCRISDTYIDEASDPINVAKIGKTKVSLSYIRKISQIKQNNFGDCYRSLGDTIWQVLCEIRLSNIDNIHYSTADLGRSFKLSETLVKRYVSTLEMELLIETSEIEGTADRQNLYLTQFGQMKLESTLEQCTSAFFESFVFSDPEMSKSRNFG